MRSKSKSLESLHVNIQLNSLKNCTEIKLFPSRISNLAVFCVLCGQFSAFRISLRFFASSMNVECKIFRAIKYGNRFTKNET